MKSKKRKSKKPSNTKELQTKPLETYTFFVDRSSGRHGLAEGLKKLGLNVETHDDHFEPTTPDVVWLTECGEKNWIIISSDVAIKKNILEKRALLAANVASFFFTSPKFTTEQQIKAVTAGLTRIKNYVLHKERPFIARISKDGTIELWVDHKGVDCIERRLANRKSKRLKKLIE